MGPHQAAPQPHQVPDRYLRNPHFPLSLLMLAQTPRTRKTCSHSQSIHFVLGKELLTNDQAPKNRIFQELTSQ